MVNPLSLVVDDEPLVRSFVTRALQQDGFRTLEAQDGIEALALIRGLGDIVSLLGSDLKMPRMRGDVLAVSTRKAFPSIPILLMSGHSDDPPDDLRFAFIAKPFAAASLRVTVKALLNQQTQT